MRMNRLFATFVCIAVATLFIVPGTFEAAARATRPALGNITATGPALALLKRARVSLAPEGTIDTVKTLTFDLSRTSGGGTPYRSTFRFLFPDLLQEVAPAMTFTFDGSTFSQIPDRGDAVKATARRNTLRQFTRYCLLLLLRAPSQVPVTATLPSGTATGTPALRFVGPDDFELTLELDPVTALPQAMVHSVTVSQGDSVVGQAERRVVIAERKRIDGISFPIKLHETMRSVSATLELSGIRCNEGVTPADLRAR